MEKINKNTTNYENPTALYLVSQICKKNQEDFIKTYLKENNLETEDSVNIIKKCIGFSHRPKVVQKKNKEKLQLV